MIPKTYPSEYITYNGKTRAIVYPLNSVSGLIRWVDYIPVKGLTTENTAVENTYANDGYIVVKSLESLTGLVPFKDYVPVFEDNAATVAWGTGNNGYIPVFGLFSVLNLFANGEQGAWYDPSDLTTLFQNATGTTPVTAVEQPVGLMLDKSKGLVLGSELVDTANTAAAWTPISLNIVTQDGDAVKIETVDNPTGATLLLNQIGGLSVDMVSNRWYVLTAEVKINTGSAQVLLINGGNGTPSVTFTSTAYIPIKFYVLKTTSNDITLRFNGLSSPETVWIRNISVRELPGNHAFQSTSAARPVLSARYNLLTNTETLATQSVTTAATTQRLSFTGTGSITLSGTATGTYSAGTHSITTTAGTLTLTVSGTVTQADLRVSNDGLGIPTYQRVNTSTDYDTAGFPLYIKPNGSSQWMQTNSINFSATDKVTVVSGVRKLSDAARAMLVEFGNGQLASFRFEAPNTVASNYQFSSFASLEALVTASAAQYAAPVTDILTGTGNISGDSAILRIDGTQAASSTADQGTGNYGNYPLYLFARGGTTLWFSGRFYGLIVRGAQSSDAQISNTEAWMNSKTKAY